MTREAKRCMLKILVGVEESRWAPRSSKPLRGAAEAALVGSTPIHSRYMLYPQPREPLPVVAAASKR